MSNISLKQYEEFLSLLEMDEQCIDIRYLIFKYVSVVGDYYLDDERDVDKLDLIIDAFLFFSQFVLDYDLDNIVQMLSSVDDVIKTNVKYTDDQMIAVITKLLAIEMIYENSGLIDAKKWCEVLYKLASTIKPIQKYEEQYGDVNSLLKELKMKKKC